MSFLTTLSVSSTAPGTSGSVSPASTSNWPLATVSTSSTLLTLRLRSLFQADRCSWASERPSEVLAAVSSRSCTD